MGRCVRQQFLVSGARILLIGHTLCTANVRHGLGMRGGGAPAALVAGLILMLAGCTQATSRQTSNSPETSPSTAAAPPHSPGPCRSSLSLVLVVKDDERRTGHVPSASKG